MKRFILSTILAIGLLTLCVERSQAFGVAIAAGGGRTFVGVGGFGFGAAGFHGGFNHGFVGNGLVGHGFGFNNNVFFHRTAFVTAPAFFAPAFGGYADPCVGGAGFQAGVVGYGQAPFIGGTTIIHERTVIRRIR